MSALYRTRTIPMAIFFYLSWMWSAFATPEPLSLRYSLDLRAHKGRSFLSTMMDRESGIKAQFDQDYVDQYTFAKWEDIQSALENFDLKVVKKVKEAFGNDMAELRSFGQSLEGQPFSPTSIVDIMKGSYQGRGNIFALAHFFALASHAGTVVKIDDNNYYYNFGYKSGEDADDVKSGRSYGATTLHNANDASDVMYLGELETFLRQGQGTREFYETLMAFITETDTAGLARAELVDSGKAAATDFIAIYTAELNRHIMVNLDPRIHPWENDLAEATFVSVYSSQSGKLIKEGSLRPAPLKDFWAMSPMGNGRSGIGIGRKDRRQLQQLISRFEREQNPEVVEAVESLIGKTPDGDVFRGLMEFINNRKNLEKVDRDARKITKAFVDFLMQVKGDEAAITEFLEK